MFPDFLIIGAQKAGTTWLDRNLRRHPQIWLPPEKEIHFFDLPQLLPFSALRLAPVRSIRHWARFRMRRDADRVRANPENAQWYQRYYWQLRSERWYRSLFSPAPGQMAGETTPRYAVLPERRILQAHRLIPKCRIIYLLRDPIDRAWSDLAMLQSAKFGQGGLQNLDTNTALRALLSTRRVLHSSYLANVERWERIFSPEQIFIGFHDQIRETPRKMLSDVYGFLSVDNAPSVTRNIIARKINTQRYSGIPKHFEQSLARILQPEIQALDARFNNQYTARWRKRAEACL